MTIEFETPKPIAQMQTMLQSVAENMMRSVSREFDENEHAIPWDYVEFMHTAMKAAGLGGGLTPGDDKPKEGAEKRPPIGYQRLAAQIEMLSWGDVGFYLITPGGGLGAAAVQAAGSPEQRIKFLARFNEDKPTYAAMCMTEAGAGSDTSAIRTRAVLDEVAQEWVINGEKIFVTGGDKSFTEYEKLGKGFIVVWASIDPTAGRAGMRAFVVESGTKGVSIVKLEHKLGIRASDTAVISLVDARVPYDNVLGSATVEKTTTGFKGAMATFDASRPLVAASTLGVGRAALEFLKEKLAENGLTIPYNLPYHKLTAVQRDVLEMEAEWRAAYLLTLRSISMLDQGQHNSLEASMAKVKSGKVVTEIAQKAVGLLGSMGYSREWLAEKWMRDAKIGDIYEGTGQINTLIVARRILGYTRRELA